MVNSKIDKKIENKPKFFSATPATVGYDNRLCPRALMLFGKITALCKVEGFCWATNNYFATLYKVNKMSVSRWIKQLVDYGYIKSVIEYDKETKQVIRRKLFPNINLFSGEVIFCNDENNVKNASNNNDDDASNNDKNDIFETKENIEKIYASNVPTPIYKNVYTPIYKNVEENNRNINNNILRKKERKEDLNDNSLFKRENENEIKKISAEKNSTEKKKISFDEIIENYTQNEELRTELKEHLRVRKAKRAALTDHALELSLKKLDSIANSDEQKIEIVQNSTMNGWTAFYPLRTVKTNSISGSNYNINNYEKTMDVFDAQVKKEEEEKKKQEQEQAKLKEILVRDHDKNVERYGKQFAEDLETSESIEDYYDFVNDYERRMSKGLLPNGEYPPELSHLENNLFESPEEEARVIEFGLSGARRL